MESDVEGGEERDDESVVNGGGEDTLDSILIRLDQPTRQPAA